MIALPPLLRDGPANAHHTLLFAHGAGAPMDHPFMQTITDGLVQRGHHVVRFEFPYMQQRRIDGKRRPPNPAKTLDATLLTVVDALGGGQDLIIGGKSMGGRVASRLADTLGVRGLFCLGYPFHPPGKPDKLRTAHLASLTTPTLILQGDRDPMGTAAEVAGYDLSPAIDVHYLPDGEHSFKPRKRSGHTEAGNLSAAIDAIDRFVRGLAGTG